MMKGIQFTSNKDAMDAYFEAVSTIDKDEWGGVLKNGLRECNSAYIAMGYLEKLK